MSFSPGGDSQPEITGADGSRQAAQQRGQVGSDLNFSTFPITSVWAGKMTGGGRLCASLSALDTLLALRTGPIGRSPHSSGLQSLDEPRHGRQRRGSLVLWDDSALGLGLGIIHSGPSGAQ